MVFTVQLSPSAGGDKDDLNMLAWDADLRRSPRVRDVSRTGRQKAVKLAASAAALPPHVVLMGSSAGARNGLGAARILGGQAAGLVCCSWPMVAPNGETRAGELLDPIPCPVLFLVGDRDPYMTRAPGLGANIQLLQTAAAAAPAGSRVVVVAGAEHSIRKTPAHAAVAAQAVIDFLAAL